MKKDDKILITGAHGLVGRNLFNRLVFDENYENVYHPTSGELDLLSQKETEMFFYENKFDYVFHCAAVVGGIQANIDRPYEFLFDNLTIQNNVIHYSIGSDVTKVIFLASSCMYPANYKQPLKEEYILNANPEKTNEGYAIAKIAGAKLCEYANRQFVNTTKFIVLAPTNLYGPYDNFSAKTSHVLQSLIRKIYNAKKNNYPTVEIWGDGTPRREFLYVDDIVDCMIWSMENIDKTETFLNVGTGEDYSIIELANMVKKIIGYDGEFVFDKTKPNGMKMKRLDVSKIAALGWSSKIKIEDGIKRTIEYYKLLT